MHEEIVMMHFGQAGIQTGHAIWETMLAEHEIDPNGVKSSSVLPEYSVGTFFHKSPSDHYIPRTMMIDTEPTVIDEIKTGFYRNVFHLDTLISGNEDTSNNFARGYYTIGRPMLHDIINKTRYIIETCDNFCGFITYGATSGGTGSGLESLIMDNINIEYPNKPVFSTFILPSQNMNDAIVGPYNTMLHLGPINSTQGLQLLINNESLYMICENMLNIFRPSYSNINRLLAPILSSITAPLRYAEPSSGNLREIVLNLVPFPSITFPSISYSPFQSGPSFVSVSSESLTTDLFIKTNSLLNLDLSKGKLMASLLFFRGSHNRMDIIQSLNQMKKDKFYRWVDWCPTGFKVIDNYLPALHTFSPQPERSILMLCNHSGMSEVFESIITKFKKLYRKRSFVHWFVGEGMEEQDFVNATTAFIDIQIDYKELGQVDLDENNVEMYESEKFIIDDSPKPKYITKDTVAILKKVESSAENFPQQISAEKIDVENQEVTMNDNITYKNDSEVNEKSNDKDDNDKSNIKNILSMPEQAESAEFEFSSKAKEILLANVSQNMSEDLRKRLLNNQ